jgi:hypothetical protein
MARTIVDWARPGTCDPIEFFNIRPDRPITFLQIFPQCDKEEEEGKKRRRHEINGLCWSCRPRSEIHTHLSGNGLLWEKRAGAIASLPPYPEEQLPCQMEREREKRSIYTHGLSHLLLYTADIPKAKRKGIRKNKKSAIQSHTFI